MATTLNNIARLNGQYDGAAFDEQTASEDTELIDMAITKTANKQVWAGGELAYTVAVTNNETALPLTNLVMTDTLDPAVISLVPNSVTINGTAAPAASVTYVEATGLLTVTVPDIAVGATTNVIFRVTKK